MAEQVKIVAETRTETGKGVGRRLRADGRVPAVVYGGEVAATPVHVDTLELYHALHTSAGANVLIRLQVDGEEHLTIPRGVQRHPVRGDLIHVDFVALQRDQRIRVEVPLHLSGGEEVAAPGVVQQVLYTIPIHVRPLDIPEEFTLEISEMVIGDVMRVEDLVLPEGAEYDIEADRVVVTVVAPTIIEEPEEEEPEDALLAELIEEGLSEEEIAARLEEAKEAAEEEEGEGEEPAGEGESEEA
jgi:large subunit ribosomal protein L25